MQARPTVAATPRLVHSGSTHRVLRKRRPYHSPVKGPGMPLKGSALSDITASQRIGA